MEVAKVSLLVLLASITNSFATSAKRTLLFAYGNSIMFMFMIAIMMMMAMMIIITTCIIITIITIIIIIIIIITKLSNLIGYQLP